MEIIKYKRTVQTFHIHATFSATCLYVPDEKVVLFSEGRGSFGGVDYSITDRPEMLEEAKALAEGRDPNKGKEAPDFGGVSYSEAKRFDYDGDKLRQLIKDARLRSELETKVKSGIEAVIAASE